MGGGLRVSGVVGGERRHRCSVVEVISAVRFQGFGVPPPLVLAGLYSKHSVRHLIATVVHRQIFRVGSLGPKLFGGFAIEVCDRPKVFVLTLDQVSLS